jgi:hypothetical protein
MEKIILSKVEVITVTATYYNEDFIKKAKALGGFWNESEKDWEFPMDKEKEVKELVLEIYGDFETED